MDKSKNPRIGIWPEVDRSKMESIAGYKADMAFAKTIYCRPKSLVQGMDSLLSHNGSGIAPINVVVGHATESYGRDLWPVGEALAKNMSPSLAYALKLFKRRSAEPFAGEHEVRVMKLQMFGPLDSNYMRENEIPWCQD